MADYARIGPTAHVTAYAWHRLGMPYGELFTTREGARMYWAFRGTVEWTTHWLSLPSLLDFLEFRHRLMEAQLERLAPDRVIELGAGLSRRGITWVLDRNIPYVEIDLPHMSAAKRAMLERGPGRVRRALERSDLELRSTDIFAPGFADELAALLAGAERPVIISEGMLPYFPQADAEKLLRNIVAGLRSVGVTGHYLTDVQRADRERKFGPAPQVLRQAINLVTRGQGADRPFRDLEHVDRFFALAGFDAGEELRPRDFYEREPRLRDLRSPTSIWLARVEPK
ncbi:class I SAM-dependent methyltransferase [Nannocystaceae bacterium ST9]